jgi:hypothetical protein
MGAPCTVSAYHANGAGNTGSDGADATAFFLNQISFTHWRASTSSAAQRKIE